MCTFVGLLLLGLLATTSARMTPRTPIAAARAPPPLLMARWQPSDMAAIRQPLPPEVEGLLSDDTPRDGVERLWGVMVKCYATEEDAITAAERNTGTILPYLNRPGNIEGVFAYLVDSLGLEEAQDVVKKNPGVLACDPRIVAQTNPDDIVSAANNVDVRGRRSNN